MKRVALVVFISIITMSASAFADGSSYFTPYAGATLLTDSDLDNSSYPNYDFRVEYDLGYSFGATVGYDFGRYRLEGEAAYLLNAVDKIVTNNTIENSNQNADARLWAILFNFNYDFIESGRFNPYLSAGIGRGNLDYNGDNDALWVYQLGAGLIFALNDRLALDFRYRWLTTETAEFSEGSTKLNIDYSSHSALLGLRISF